MMRRGVSIVFLLNLLLGITGRTDRLQADQLEFFERKIRPLLVEHCYPCHSAQADEVKGGLRLDLQSGWQLGGDSGEPSIVPSQPELSPLIWAVQHLPGASPMPPTAEKLPEELLADLTEWIRLGAVDPRQGELTREDPHVAWEAKFQQRLKRWSLQPISRPAPPPVQRSGWAHTEVDRFILNRLEASNLQPAPEAQRHALIRRLSFALTGLPPEPTLVQQTVNDSSDRWYENLVDHLLNSPHYGERWARHWMDVVHYADTHGYEWDVPAKNAWLYRDYLIRAFSQDVPFRDLVMEQIAGDLMPERIDSETGMNQALIGPMMLRLGERRHGDNSALEGVTQEGIANTIDTLGKAFLGVTLACAQCHDHKLDAVEQRDFYSMAGMLMSTRFSARCVDAVDPNAPVIDRLLAIKQQLKTHIVAQWLNATDPESPDGVRSKLSAIAVDEKTSDAFPTTLVEFWKRSLTQAVTTVEFQQEQQRRRAHNGENLTLMVDFANPALHGGWRWEGFGMKHGLARDGDWVVADAGDNAVVHLLPAGRYTHLWSPRLAGSLQSPNFNPADQVTFSVEAVAGKFASQSFIVDRAINPERLQFVAAGFPKWLSWTAGQFDSLEGTIDTAPRRVYFEMATKSLNNYFPPRVGYGGVSEAEISDERSWFGAARIYQHPPGKPPQDELARFSPLFEQSLLPQGKVDEKTASEANSIKSFDWAAKLTELLRQAIMRWQADCCSAEDVRLINDALQHQLLPNQLSSSSQIDALVCQYRTLEPSLQADRTVGSAADWQEGEDERIGIRGSYTELGPSVPRANVRLLAGSHPALGNSSGRLQWARQITSPDNPLLARVYVNRIWHYLFGAGLVRTTDDFGHLGELPSHPELLDYLASYFIQQNWSTKSMIRLLVTSSVWRQSSAAQEQALEIDPENRLWHSMLLRRLEAEAIRDSMLAVSGRLDRRLFGPSVEPYRTAEDASKRLFKGPLDGQGRRSIYLEMTLMEPPRFLALFNQPLPKQTVGKRDVTNVPDQALALLNDPLPTELAKVWSEQMMDNRMPTAQQLAAKMLEAAWSRPASLSEIESLVALADQCAQLRSLSGNILEHPSVWQDVAHALFNTKEFIYVP